MISLMFHSAGLNRHPWRSQYVSEPLSCLAMQLQVIAREGYRTVFMEDASLLVGSNKNKVVCLTFDDGYLDNWVHIFPLLQKLNLKATIFITPEFVDPGDIVRPQISADKVNEEEHDAMNCCAGFLSWPEMLEMEKSGLVEIQSHALSHTWYFSGPKIVDFWRPGIATELGGAVWMLWNLRPDLKPYYLQKAAEYEKFIPYGTPIYEHGKSLEIRRYFPNELELHGRLISCVNKSHDFFSQPNWYLSLKKIVENYRQERGDKGRYESKDSYVTRVENELSESKQIIEEKLKKEVKGICWPGGAVTKEVVEIALGIGYEYFTLPSKWKTQPKEIVDLSSMKMIPRISAPYKNIVKGKLLSYMGPKQFLWALKAHSNVKLYKLFIRLNQIYCLGKNFSNK